MSDQKKFEEALRQHLAGALYTNASPEQQRRALLMAERDVLSQTGMGVDRENPLFIDAVAEQAVFLLLNVDKIYSPLRDVISESVEGAGSVTYNNDGKPFRFMSLRAMELCTRLSSGSLELTRG